MAWTFGREDGRIRLLMMGATRHIYVAIMHEFLIYIGFIVANAQFRFLMIRLRPYMPHTAATLKILPSLRRMIFRRRIDAD